MTRTLAIIAIAGVALAQPAPQPAPPRVSLTWTARPNEGASGLHAGFLGLWSNIPPGSTLLIVPPGSALYVEIPGDNGGAGKARYVGQLMRAQAFADGSVVVSLVPDDNQLVGMVAAHLRDAKAWNWTGPNPPPANGRASVIDINGPGLP